MHGVGALGCNSNVVRATPRTAKRAGRCVGCRVRNCLVGGRPRRSINVRFRRKTATRGRCGGEGGDAEVDCATNSLETIAKRIA